MIKKLKPREKRLLIISLTLIGLIWLQSFIFSPAFEHLKNIRQQIYSKTLILSKYEKFLNHQNQIEELFKKYLGVFKKDASSQEQISNFLEEVDKLSQKSQIKIINMKPLGLKEDEIINKIILEIEVESDPLSLGRFLLELKNSSLIYVHSLRISASSSGDILKCLFILSKVVV